MKSLIQIKFRSSVGAGGGVGGIFATQLSMEKIKQKEDTAVGYAE